MGVHHIRASSILIESFSQAVSLTVKEVFRVEGVREYVKVSRTPL